MEFLVFGEVSPFSLRRSSHPVVQKPGEKIGNRKIRSADLKNKTSSTHAQLQNGDVKLPLLAKGVAQSDAESYDESGFNLDLVEPTLDIGGLLVSLPFSNSSEGIRTVVTKETSHVKSWLDLIKIETGLIVGLGVRWRYAFGKQREFDAATLQLCVGRRCLIFQVGRADVSVSDLLSGFLNNRDVKIVGVGMEKPLQKLREDCGLHVAHAIDIGTLAAAKFEKPELRKAG